MTYTKNPLIENHCNRLVYISPRNMNVLDGLNITEQLEYDPKPQYECMDILNDYGWWYIDTVNSYDYKKVLNNTIISHICLQVTLLIIYNVQLFI